MPTSIRCASADGVRAAAPFVLAAFWVPLATCAGVAFTPDPTGTLGRLSGPVAHLLAFAYLTGALFPAHFRWPRGGMARTGRAADGEVTAAHCVLAAILWMLAFGVLIEVGQLFVAGRSGELADLLPDAAGIALGCCAQGVWARAGRSAVRPTV